MFRSIKDMYMLGTVGGLTARSRPATHGSERFRRESELRIWMCRGLKGVDHRAKSKGASPDSDRRLAKTAKSRFTTLTILAVANDLMDRLNQRAGQPGTSVSWAKHRDSDPEKWIFRPFSAPTSAALAP